MGRREQAAGGSIAKRGSQGTCCAAPTWGQARRKGSIPLPSIPGASPPPPNTHLPASPSLCTKEEQGLSHWNLCKASGGTQTWCL